MTNKADILGRPPIMKPIKSDDPDPNEDWKGQSLIRNVKKHHETGPRYIAASNLKRKAARRK